MAHASDNVAAAIRAPREEVCLLGNATDACMAVALRWAKLLAAERRQKGADPGSVLLLDWTYASNKLIMQGTCGSGAASAQIVEAAVPFPLQSPAQILDSLQTALRQHRPRFALLEHVMSQPAMILPVAEMVALCRDAGVEEVAVDAGKLPPLLPSLGIPFGSTFSKGRRKGKLWKSTG